MRVITGKARGSRLTSLEGLETRPTTDKVKESIFNIIQFDVYDSECLDLFSGSGALGIEALSRGAKSCTFVDSNPKAINIIKKNIEHTKLGDNSTVVNTDYKGFLYNCTKQFDLILLDPPYGKNLVNMSILELICKKVLKKGTIIVAECEKDAIINIENGVFVKKEAIYGKTKVLVMIYDREGA